MTGGRKKVGHPPLSAEVVAKIEEAVRANPKARWEWIARKTGVSRSSVGRVMPARRRAALGLGS